MTATDRAAGLVAPIRLTVPLPPSTNHLYACVTRGGKHRRIKTATTEQYHHDVGWAVLQSHTPLPALAGPLVVTVRLFFKDRRRHDVDNIKVLLDSLAAAFAFDDSQVAALHVSKAVDRARPRCEVEIERTLVGGRVA